MAVTFRSKSFTSATGTSATGTEPAGAASGDMLVALVLAAAVVSQPTGWAQKYKDTQGGVSWVVSCIARGASAPSLAWTWAGSVYYEIHILCVQGGAAVAFDAASTAGGKGNSAHNPDPGAVAPVASTSLAICGGVNFGSLTAWINPAGYVVRSDNTAGNDGVMCDKSLSSTASEDPAAITQTAAPGGDWWDGFTMTFTDVSAAGGQVPYQPQYQAAPVMAQ